MEKHSVSRLIGAPPGYVGYDEGGALTEAVRRRPYSVLLLDEVEKAHPDVFNVLLQVLDDGRLTDGQGRTVDFKNAVVVMTSNLGSELWGRSREATRAEITAALRQHFRPEFLNRIDEVVVFHSLTTGEVRQIVDVQLERLSRLLADRRLALDVTDAAREQLALTGWDPDFGARPLKRAIQRELQDPLALRLLQGEFPEGSTIHVDAVDGKLTFEALTPGEAVLA